MNADTSAIDMQLATAANSAGTPLVRWPGRSLKSVMMELDIEDHRGWTSLKSAESQYADDIWVLRGLPTAPGIIDFSHVPETFRNAVKDWAICYIEPRSVAAVAVDPTKAVDVALRRRQAWPVVTVIGGVLAMVEAELARNNGAWSAGSWANILDTWKDEGKKPNTWRGYLSSFRTFHDEATSLGHVLPFSRPFGQQSIKAVIGDRSFRNTTEPQEQATLDLLAGCLHFIDVATDDLMERVRFYEALPRLARGQYIDKSYSFVDEVTSDPFLATGATQPTWLPAGSNLFPESGGLERWLRVLVQSSMYVVACITGLRGQDVLAILPDSVEMDEDGLHTFGFVDAKGKGQRVKQRRIAASPEVVKALRIVEQLHNERKLPTTTHTRIGTPVLFSSRISLPMKPSRAKGLRREQEWKAGFVDPPSRQRLADALNDVLGRKPDHPNAIVTPTATVISATTLARMSRGWNGALAVHAVRQHAFESTTYGYIGATVLTPSADAFPYPDKQNEHALEANAGDVIRRVLEHPDAIAGGGANRLRQIATAANSEAEALPSNAKLMKRLQKSPDAAAIQNGAVAVCTSLDGGACRGAGPTECVHGCGNAATLPEHRAVSVLLHRRSAEQFGATHFLVEPTGHHLDSECAEEMAMTDDQLLNQAISHLPADDQNRIRGRIDAASSGPICEKAR